MQRCTLASICYDECIGIRIAFAETEQKQNVVERAMEVYVHQLVALTEEAVGEAASDQQFSPYDLDVLLTVGFHVLLETQSDALLLAPQRVLTARLWTATVSAQGNITTLINKALDANDAQADRLKPHLVAIRTRFSPKSQKGRDR